MARATTAQVPTTLSYQPAQKSRLEEEIEARGHIAFFLPKFHCELNFIELYWAQTKERTRKRADFSWAGLKESMWSAFGQPDCLNDSTAPYEDDGVPTRLNSLFLQRASRKAREFFALYAAHPGKAGWEIPALRHAMKAKRHHREPLTAGVVDRSSQ